MQIVETLNEGLKRGYNITISASDIDTRVDAEVKKLAPQVKMPGFRPGKVPANLIRKMHGEALAQDALNASVRESVDQTIAEKKLRPAIQPSVTLEDGYENGKDAVINIALEVLPEIPVPDIDGLKLERLSVDPGEDAINEAVGRLAESQQSFDTAAKSYKAKSGDQVLIDFEGKVDGVPFDGGKGEGMAVTIGSGQLIPGFEDQLIGLKANDETVINVTFPADYNAENLAGKDATFDIVVGEVKKPAETKIDDDFAKSLGLEGIDKLKELMSGQIEQELNGLTRTHMKRRLLDQLAVSHDFDVPPTMVEAEFDQIWKQLEAEAAKDENPEDAKAEMEKDKDEYRDIAVRRVRLGLLLSEIGQANGVEVSQQEMQMLVSQAAQQYRPEDREKFVEYIQNEPMAAAQLRAPMYEDKVVDFLFEKAEITERKVSREELEAAIEAEEDAEAEAKPAKKPAAKKAPAKKAAAKKPAAKKADADGDKPAAKKPAAKKAPAKKAAAKKPAAKKAD
jgi:trigger factor